MKQMLSKLWSYPKLPEVDAPSPSDMDSVAPKDAADTASTSNDTSHIRGDEPIGSAEDDVLGRQHLAAAVAGTMRDLDASDGAVVAIVGPWGSGKTSLIRLIQRELERTPAIPVLEFNPWMFSRADELIERFFFELSAQLKDKGGRLSEIAADLAAYGKVLEPITALPVVGPWVQAGKSAIDALNSAVEHKQGGVLGKRKKLIEKLSKLSPPMVVVIDDIDRLTTDEIRDVFKLVRLTGNFPNLIYVLAFDRERVELALEDQGLPGREYLEKIAQAIVVIPEIPGSVLHQQLEAMLAATIEHTSGTPMRVTERLIEVFLEIIRPNIRHMRDIRRYGASLPATIRSLDNRVAIEDVLALEALRLFQPDIFKWISRHRVALTYSKSQSFFTLTSTDEAHHQAISELLKQYPEHSALIRSTIRQLFPLAAHHVENVVYDESSLPEWQTAHRVAHPQFLSLFLERVAEQELAEFWFAEEAMALVVEPNSFVVKMSSITPQERVAVIRALQTLVPSVPAEQVEPALIGVLNLADSLPKFGPPTLDLGRREPRGELRVLVYRLLGRTATEGRVDENLVRNVLRNVHPISAKLLLLKIIGHDQNSGHGLVEQHTSEELEAELRAEIRSRAPDDLAREIDLLWTLMWMKKSRLDSEPELELPEHQLLQCRILRDALKRAIIGGKTIEVEYQLYWEILIELFGGAKELQAIVESCAEIDGDDDLKLAIEVARQYMQGWRPQFS